jgi:hypothetical protein
VAVSIGWSCALPRDRGSFIAEEGYERAGKHHEIYLSDPRRAAPEKMKTVLRQPMASSGAADGRR